jgi:hypothetical protein
VNVTAVPAHTVDPGLAAIETEAGRAGLTTIVSALDVAGLPVAQVAEDVSTQVMMSPFDGTRVYVVLLVPTFDPFLFH